MFAGICGVIDKSGLAVLNKDLLSHVNDKTKLGMLGRSQIELRDFINIVLFSHSSIVHNLRWPHR